MFFFFRHIFRPLAALKLSKSSSASSAQIFLECVSPWFACLFALVFDIMSCRAVQLFGRSNFELARVFAIAQVPTRLKHSQNMCTLVHFSPGSRARACASRRRRPHHSRLFAATDRFDFGLPPVALQDLAKRVAAATPPADEIAHGPATR